MLRFSARNLFITSTEIPGNMGSVLTVVLLKNLGKFTLIYQINITCHVKLPLSNTYCKFPMLVLDVLEAMMKFAKFV